MVPSVRKKPQKASGPRATVKVNKSAWIRKQRPTLAAKDVVEKAKGEGIKLSVAQVYTARSTAAKLGKSSNGKGRGKRGASKPGSKATSRGGGEELAFRRLVLSIGLERAETYLDDLKRAVGL